MRSRSVPALALQQGRPERPPRLLLPTRALPCLPAPCLTSICLLQGIWWMPEATDAQPRQLGGGSAALQAASAAAAVGAGEGGLAGPELLKLAAAMRMNTGEGRGAGQGGASAAGLGFCRVATNQCGARGRTGWRARAAAYLVLGTAHGGQDGHCRHPLLPLIPPPPPDVRRAAFCVIMGSEDCVDAVEKLLRLGLKGEQERELVRVTVECCLQVRRRVAATALAEPWRDSGSEPRCGAACPQGRASGDGWAGMRHAGGALVAL